MRDIKGRAYAKVAATKAGSVLEADGDFTCISEGSRLVVERDADGQLYVPCRDGSHHLAGQFAGTGAGAHYVGLYPAA